MLRKMFALPTPIELGKSSSDALPMEEFGAREGDYTWEDWHRDVKKMHPIKYLLNEELSPWFSVKMMRVKDVWSWVKYHTYKRNHIIDIRQPKDAPDSYRYGWCDADFKILYANFKILCDFVEKEKAHDHFDIRSSHTPEQLAEEGLEDQAKFFDELDYLYDWWKNKRPQMLREKDETLTAWHDSRKKVGRKLTYDENLWSKMNELDAEYERQEDDALLRLIKIRKRMWI